MTKYKSQPFLLPCRIKLTLQVIMVFASAFLFTAILAQGTPSDCQSIVEDYSKGKLLMYEYKIQMKRCMNKAKEGGKSITQANDNDLTSFE